MRRCPCPTRCSTADRMPLSNLRSAVTHTGGVTALKKVLDFAAVDGVESGRHGPTDLSPVGMAAALHLDLAVHNFGIQEYVPHTAATLGGSGPRTRSQTGCCTRPTRPGWGWSWTWTRPAGSPTVPRTCR